MRGVLLFQIATRVLAGAHLQTECGIGVRHAEMHALITAIVRVAKHLGAVPGVHDDNVPMLGVARAAARLLVRVLGTAPPPPA